MDPISVSVSIVGLLSAAAKVSEIMTKFVGNMRDAPKLAQSVVNEVEDMKLCLHQLQDFITSSESDGANSRSRKAMVTVDQLCVVLANCVLIFSDLEVAVEGLRPRASVSIGNRLRWVAKESTISRLMQRLQASKMSLNLILTTLTCADVVKAQQSIDVLTGLVHDVLSSNLRLEQSSHITQSKHLSAPSALETNDRTDDGTALSGPSRDTWCSDTTIVAGRNVGHGMSFEHDLRQSRVYARTSRTIGQSSDPDILSLPSSTARSMGSSFFSGLSLADVSNISLISFDVPMRCLSNGNRYMDASVSRFSARRSPDAYCYAPRSSGKILLSGIANAGKSTILKHLQLLQGIAPTPVEVDVARRVILAELVDTFRYRMLQGNCAGFVGDFQGIMHVLTHASCALYDWENSVILRQEHLVGALDILCQLWAIEEVKRAITSGPSTSQASNISHIMDNLGDIAWGEPSTAHVASLCAYVKTVGLYKSKIAFDPFDFVIYDVSGSRNGRRNWSHCLTEKMDYIIYVVDLNGYCQRFQEDYATTEMWESLRVFDTLVNKAEVKNLPIFLLLNKADLFEKTIVQQPINYYLTDYDGGADYFKACDFFKNRFVRLDRRPPGKLHCYVTNSLDTTEFQNAWQQIHEKMVHISLKY